MNALRVGGSSTHVCASTMPEATIVSGRALTIAHHRPSVTTPIGTDAARSSSSMRSTGLVAQPSVSGSRSESTGSTTRTSAPVVSPWVSAPVAVTVTAWSGERTGAAVAGPYADAQPRTSRSTTCTQVSRAAR